MSVDVAITDTKALFAQLVGIPIKKTRLLRIIRSDQRKEC